MNKVIGEAIAHSMPMGEGIEWAIHCANNPEFGKGGHIHNWRNYVPVELQDVWSDLSVEARACVIVMAERQASNEEWD